MITLPNILTFLRILFIPLILSTFFWDTPLAQGIRVITFIVACITDFLDGYFARIWSQTTRLGQFLDPLADKLLIASVLLFLAGFGVLDPLDLVPASIILCREMLVSGLRETLSTLNRPLPVTIATKWKTAIQMLSLTLLLVDTPYIAIWGKMLLWLSGLMTLVTGIRYLWQSWEWLGKDDIP